MLTITIFIILLTQPNVEVSTIKGEVNDQKGRPVPGANIFLEATYYGTSSNGDGEFGFTAPLIGTYTLVVQAMGYTTYKTEVELDLKTVQKSIVLYETVSALSAVNITAGVMEASDESRTVVLRPIDIVTTPTAMGDIAGAFQTLPGSSTVGNDGRLFVRGGDASETAIYVDGLRVENAFRTTAPNVPARTRFNPNLYKGSFFSTGGYSAEYGQALSSVLVLNTVDIPLRTQTDLSLMTVGGGLDHTQVWENSSIIASVNLLDLEPYHRNTDQNFNWDRSPYNRNAELSARAKTGSDGILKGYLYKEQGGMALRDDTGEAHGLQPKLIKLSNNYTYAQTTARFIRSDIIYRGGISFSDNSDIHEIDEFRFKTNFRAIHAKLVADKYYSGRFTLKTGAEAFYTDYTEENRSEDSSRKFLDSQFNLFSEGDYSISNSFVVRAGFRTGYSTLNDHYRVQPRVSFAFNLPEDRGQFSMAAGGFSQNPEAKFNVLDNTLKPVRSQHLIANYLIHRNGRIFRSELFYKNYKGLLTYEGTPFRYENIRQSGSGFARGFDLLYRDQSSIKNTDFWLSYSFTESERLYASFKNRVQPSFAPGHNGTAVIKTYINKLKSQFGLSLIVNDGYVYTDPNKPGEMNSRTRAYANLSMSWSYLPKPNVIIHLAGSNVTGRDNIFSYQFSPNESLNGSFERIPVRQVAPRFIMLGVFITFSKEKFANQLNNL